MEREYIVMAALIIAAVGMVAGTIIILLENRKYKFIGQSEFVVTDKREEHSTLPSTITGVNATRYVVSIHSKKYGDFNIEDEQLYKDMAVKDKCYLKVYQDDSENYRVEY